ncbi:MAG TPA: hypothetical protein VFD70_20515 [Anaerolineae bacterium]|nr:hypothetical protein [Anaerolineae bacterium]
MKYLVRVTLVAILMLIVFTSVLAASASPVSVSSARVIPPLAPPAAPPVAPNAQGCSGTPTIQYAYANPPSIYAGQTSTIYWGLVGNANAAYFQFPNGNREGIGTPGSKQVNPTETKTYLVIGVCGSNTAQIPVTVNVNNSPGCNGTPQITSFSANPTNIQAGQQSTLSWGPVNNAQYVQLNAQNQGASGVPAPGSIQVRPGSTTTYYLTAWCQNNSVQAQATVNVSNPPPPTPPPPVCPGNNVVNSIQVQTSDNNTFNLTINYYWNGEEPPGRMNAAGTNNNPLQATNTGASNLTSCKTQNTRIQVVGVGRGVPTQFWACIVGKSNVELACKTVNYP